MFTFKPKKVFEKVKKLDRKQAYTIGAIVVVMVVALITLVSQSTPEDDSFKGFNSGGYDLAQLPFATDAAEQYLLANAYPDMQENGSTLLYSAQEKEERQAEDAQAAQEEEDEYTSQDGEGGSGADGGYSGGSGRSGGYGGYGGSRGGRGGRTEIGQLGTANMASAGGSGIGSYYGPQGDFRNFKDTNRRGKEREHALQTGNNAKQELANMRFGSVGAARINQNKMSNQRKIAMGGYVAGSEAFGKDGSVDLSKLQNGGFTLDTSAPPTSTDLKALEKNLGDAAKKAEEKKKEQEHKPSWWAQLLQDVAKQAISSLVDSVMQGIGDTISSGIRGDNVAKTARNQYGAQMAGKSYDQLTPTQQNELSARGIDANKWNNANTKQRTKYGSKTASGKMAGIQAKTDNYIPDTTTQYGQSNTTCPRGKRLVTKEDGTLACQ